MTPNIDKDCTHVFKENKLKKEIGFRDLNSNLQNIIILHFY